MAFVRKRSWPTINGRGCSWIVHWAGPDGRKLQKSFPTRRDANGYLKLVNSVRSDFPSPLGRGPSAIEFRSPLPNGKRIAGRAMIVDALRARYPTLRPATGEVIVHIFAMVQPRQVVADVDNLLKPVLDALAGVAYVNDTQVVECLVRKIPSEQRSLFVKIWPLSHVAYHPVSSNRVAAPVADASFLPVDGA